MISYKRPNNRGLFLGRISSVQPKNNLVVIKLADDLSTGDGVEIWVTRGGRIGFTVETIWIDGKIQPEAKACQEATIEIAEKVFPGDRVFKTYDAKLMEKARESYQKTEDILKYPVKMAVSVKVGTPLVLEVQDETGNMVKAETAFIAEKAIKHALTPQTVRAQLERLGNTSYYLTDLSYNIDGEIMVPLSELNNVRREAIEKIDRLNKTQSLCAVNDKVINNYLRERENNLPLAADKLPLLSIFVSNIESGLTAIEAGAQRIYLNTNHVRSLKSEAISFYELLEKAANKHAEVVMALPRIWHQNEKLKIEKLIRKYDNESISGYLAGDPGGIYLLQQVIESTKKIYVDYPLNVFNSLAFDFIQKSSRIASITISPEMTFGQLNDLHVSHKADRECIVHGYLPLMISEYCAVGALLGEKNAEKSCSKPCIQKHYGLKDRLGLVFPLEMDETCRMQVYNSKELCLIDDLERFRDYRINSLRIEARRYSPEEIKFITGAYKKGLRMLTGTDNKKEALGRLKTQLEGWRKDTYTKGHYYRGVL